MAKSISGLAALLLGASAAFASPPHGRQADAPSAAEVNRAVATLRDDADGAFVGAWQELRDNEYAKTLSASEVRSAELWVLLGNSIGVCRNHVNDSTMADWLTSFDGLAIGANDPALRERYRSRGLQAVDDGEKFAQARLSDPVARRKICRTEVAAVMQILKQSL